MSKLFEESGVKWWTFAVCQQMDSRKGKCVGMFRLGGIVVVGQSVLTVLAIALENFSATRLIY